MLSLIFLIPFIFLVLYLAKILYFSGGTFKSNERLDGKIVIITGANTGIGKVTAVDLVRRGARVILACRNRERAEKAASEIRKETDVVENVEVEILDTSSIESVKEFVKRIRKKNLPQLDVLINNAGVFMLPYQLSVDGYEMQFATNHLGHFLLTNLLLPLMKKAPQARIINVSSTSYKGDLLNKIKYDDVNSKENYTSIGAYASSKLANILFTREMAKRLKGTKITVNALHPGAIITELNRQNDMSVPAVIYPFYAFSKFLFWFFTKSVEQGAQTTNRLAVDKSLDNVTGKFFSDCKEIPLVTKRSQDDHEALQLWEISEKMSRLKEIEQELDSMSK